MRYLFVAAVLLLGVGCQRGGAPSFNGYVEVEPTRVAAPLAGRLVKLAVQRGTEVSAGTPLFELERDSEAAALRESRSRVERAEATARDLAQGLRPDEVAIAQAALQEAQAALAHSESDLQRQRELIRQGFASAATLSAVQAQRDADAARVRELQAQLRVARLGGRPGAREAARAEAQAAREAQAQTAWRLAQKAVVSPVTGRVEDTFYRVGEWVNAGSPVVSLIEPSAVKLRFFVPEPALAQLAIGQRVHVSCDACASTMTATVRFIASQAEFTPPVIYSRGSREKLVFMVEAWPEPADAAKLRPGQPVDIHL